MEIISLGAAAFCAGLSSLLLLGKHAPSQRTNDPAYLTRRILWRLQRMLQKITESGIGSVVADIPWLQAVARAIREQNDFFGRNLSTREYTVGLVVTWACGIAVMSMLMSSVISGVVAGIGVGIGAWVYHLHLEQKRLASVQHTLPEAYRGLAVTLSSGNTLSQALAHVGNGVPGPVGDAFAHMALHLRCGYGIEEAAQYLTRSLVAPGIDLLSVALVVSHRTGSPLKNLLSRCASLVEQHEQVERTLSVRTAQARLSVKVVCLVPAMLVGGLVLISPDFQRGLLTPAGLVSVSVAAAMDGLALFIIARLVKRALS